MKRTMNRPGGLVALLAAGCVALMAVGVVGSAQAAGIGAVKGGKPISKGVPSAKKRDPRCPNGVNFSGDAHLTEGTRFTSLESNFKRIETGPYQGQCFTGSANTFCADDRGRWLFGTHPHKAACNSCRGGRANLSIGQQVRAGAGGQYWILMDRVYPSRCYGEAKCNGGILVEVRDETVNHDWTTTVYRCEHATPANPTCTGNYQTTLPSNAVHRANEGGRFSSRGGSAYYGSRQDNCFARRDVSAGTTNCNNDTFGDPLHLTAKACFLVENEQPAQPTCTGNYQAARPSAAVRRAGENGSFNSRGGTVYYGDDATNCFNRRTVAAGTTRCNNAAFGDPLRQTTKACYLVENAPPAPACTGNHQAALPAGAARRASENGSFMSRGGTVYYGDQATNCFKRQTVRAGRTQCNNATFGDPLRLTAKACFLVENPRYPAFVPGKSLNVPAITTAGPNPVSASNTRTCRIACTRKREQGCHSWTFIARGHKNNPNRGLCYYRGQFDPARGHKFITYGTGRTSGVLQ